MQPTRPLSLDVRELDLPQWKPKSEGGCDPQSMPVTLFPTVYAIELEHGKYYVGLATAGTGVEQRLSRHAMNIGSNWCQDHKMIRLLEVWYPADKQLEDQVTMYYASMYGRGNVRGGSWAKKHQLPPTQD
jgi:predicted GIY-YIG superfamily endonuclease